MDDSISPIHIASSSPADDDSLSSASLSLMDLSRQFERYSLQPSRQNLFHGNSPLRVSSLYSPVHPNRRPTSLNSSQTVLQQQQQQKSPTRRQCNLAHLSKIHSLVEGLTSGGRPKSGYSTSTNSTTSESPLEEDTLPDLPSFTDYFPTSSALSSETEESDSSPGYRRVYAQNKVGKDLRHNLSREGMEKKNVVLKRIRYRKSFWKKRLVDSGKRQDR